MYSQPGLNSRSVFRTATSFPGHVRANHHRSFDSAQHAPRPECIKLYLLFFVLSLIYEFLFAILFRFSASYLDDRRMFDRPSAIPVRARHRSSSRRFFIAVDKYADKNYLCSRTVKSGYGRTRDDFRGCKKKIRSVREIQI